MKKAFMEFEEAHTMLLCLLYLPVPEVVVLMIFQQVSVVRHIIAAFMVVEMIGIFLVYLIWHRCPSCGKHISQIHVHKDCRCHICGSALLHREEIMSGLPKEYVIDSFEKIDEELAEGITQN